MDTNDYYAIFAANQSKQTAALNNIKLIVDNELKTNPQIANMIIARLNDAHQIIDKQRTILDIVVLEYNKKILKKQIKHWNNFAQSQVLSELTGLEHELWDLQEKQDYIKPTFQSAIDDNKKKL